MDSSASLSGRHRGARVSSPRVGLPARLAIPALLAVPILLAGCAAGGSGEGFAPGLDVDLSQMERRESGLYVQTLRAGEGPAVRPGQTVRAHYEGWLRDGTRFDSSRERGEPIRIPIGRGAVIDGWDEGIVGMRVGELRRLVIPPDLAYGERGVPGAIPPNATLIFDVELVSIR